VSSKLAFAIELTATLLVALICLVFVRAWVKLVLVVVTLVAVIGLSYLIFQNLGGFFDFSIVVPVVAIHAWLERKHQQARSRKATIRRSIAATAGVILGILLLRLQHPAAAVDPAIVAQVASMQILPSVKELITVTPQMPGYGPGVELASIEPAPPSMRSPLAPLVPDMPKVTVLPLPHTQRDSIWIAAHGVATPSTRTIVLRRPTDPTVPLDGTAFTMFRDAMMNDPLRWQDMRRQSVSRTFDVASFNAHQSFGNDSTAVMSDASYETPWPAANTELAREAFDDAWQDSREVAEMETPRHTAADNRTPLNAFPARPAGPAELSFDDTWRRLDRAARILQPSRNGFSIAFTVTPALFAGDQTMSREALAALAQVAVELMRDKDLTVKIYARRGDHAGTIRRMILHQVLREMRVESRRIELRTENDVAPGAVRVVVSL
jgi:hypothetical protein